MPYIVIITKQGIIKEVNLKDFQEDVLYKKVGFSSPNGFHCIKRNCWKIMHKEKQYILSVYGKVDGRAGQENQYDFPPPLDVPTEDVKLPFFGGLAIINSKPSVDDSTMYMIDSIRTTEWIELYDKLMEGFDDLDTVSLENEDDDEDEQEEVVPAHLLDKNGYKKDGFIVESDEEGLEDMVEEDDGDDEEEDEDCTSTSESEPETKKKSKAKAKAKAKAQQKAVKKRNTIMPKILDAMNAVIKPKKSEAAPVRKKVSKKKQNMINACTEKIEENDPFDLDSELVEEEYFT